MQISYAGKVVLVTGGTGGLGRSVVLAFVEENAKIIATYRNEAEWIALRQQAGARASLLEGIQADVTDESAMSALVAAIVARHGRLDIVVNTVGGYAGGVKLWELESTVLERMLDLNLRVGFVLGRTTIPVLLRQERGVLIQVAAKAAFDHAAGASAYAASKAAVVALMDCLAAEVKGTGVRVNSILPSIIDTEANRKSMPNADFDRWPKPEEIARVILFLASDEARVVHGAAVPVYGES